MAGDKAYVFAHKLMMSNEINLMQNLVHLNTQSVWEKYTKMDAADTFLHS